jgi:protein-S-isoprenylcysteine O-methyltransferase Ste14
MYCGYIIGSLGLLAATCNIALAVLVPVQIALFAWRAKLEEARLAEFSADYRAYQQSSGFFYPKWGTRAFAVVSALFLLALVGLGVALARQ